MTVIAEDSADLWKMSLTHLANKISFKGGSNCEVDCRERLFTNGLMKHFQGKVERPEYIRLAISSNTQNDTKGNIDSLVDNVMQTQRVKDHLENSGTIRIKHRTH